MRAPISVIIPTLNAEAELPATLACLAEGLSAGLIRELIVTDGGSEDATAHIAESAGALLISGSKGRGGQLRRGVAQAAGPWLLVLHADTHLGPGWTKAVQRHLQAAPTRAGYCKLAFRARGFGPWLIAGGANLRARLFHLPYGDQGLLMSRQLYEEIGGYPDLPLMEDVVIAGALKGRLQVLDAVAATGAERYERNGWIRQALHNLWRLARFRMGRDPAVLAATYHEPAEPEEPGQGAPR